MRKSLSVVAVEDEPGHRPLYGITASVQELTRECPQAPFMAILSVADPGCDAGELIAAAQRRRLGQHIDEAREDNRRPPIVAAAYTSATPNREGTSPRAFADVVAAMVAVRRRFREIWLLNGMRRLRTESASQAEFAAERHRY